MAITRAKQSSLRTGVTKYDNLRAGLPFTPTIGTATDGGTGSTVSVAFTANNTAGLTYTALSSPGSLTGTSTTSPITVSGLTSGTAYTFQVNAANSAGTSPYSAASNSVTPATPSSYESIASTTVSGSSTTTVTFSSIASTYSSLQLRLIVKSTNAGTSINDNNLYVRFNSDAAANYTDHSLDGYYLGGSGVQASGSGNTSNIPVALAPPNGTGLANIFGTSIVDIHDYASTTKNKTVRSLYGTDSNNEGWIALRSGVWRSTSAITSISLTINNRTMLAGTTIALYGIKG